MTDDFGIEEVVEEEGSDEWKEEIDENFVKSFVEFNRANQVANEEQALVVLYGYVSGLLPNWEDYLGILIRGGTSSGKTYMKRNVLDASFQYADREYDWLYSTTGGSDKYFIDDDAFDEARIGAFNEFNQIGSELREFLKRIVEDGGYTYGRSVSDPDSDTERTGKSWTKEPMPVIFSLADENETAVDAEMQSRMVNVQVDEGPEKNKAVHKMKHGHTNIEMPGTEHEYVYESPDLDHAVKKHLKNIPTDTDVVIPTGDERFDGDDWDESAVTEPLFNFARSESTRASAAVASMVKASALLNYHSRETVTDDANDETYIVAEPQDVANVLATRRVLLATTHNLTVKKFIVLEAFIEQGAPYDGPGASSNAKQISKQGVINYIQERQDIPTFSKSVVADLLDELDEDLVINKMDHPEDARKNIYVYDPSTQFERPNIYEYYDHFEDCVDPVKDQPIEQSIEDQLDEVNALMDTDSLAERGDTDDDGGANDNSGGLDEFTDGDDVELSRTAEIVVEDLHETMDGRWAPARVREDGSLKVTHMLGYTPIEVYDGETADETIVDMVEPERPPKFEDRAETIASPDHDHWVGDSSNESSGRNESSGTTREGDGMSVSDVDGALDDAFNELMETGLLALDVDDVGNARFEVSTP